jgi:hypothetical protein
MPGNIWRVARYSRLLAFRSVSFIAFKHKFKAKQQDAKQCNTRNHNQANH